jgi:hypothetical protein
MSFLEEFYHGHVPLDRLNLMFIALLPKTDTVVNVDGFRPISLQNCVVKMVMKILATLL